MSLLRSFRDNRTLVALHFDKSSHFLLESEVVGLDLLHNLHDFLSPELETVLDIRGDDGFGEAALRFGACELRDVFACHPPEDLVHTDHEVFHLGHLPHQPVPLKLSGFKEQFVFLVHAWVGAFRLLAC